MLQNNLLDIIPIREIKFILLDMDGTLLDRHFDDHFWEHFVPEKYAEKEGISLEDAKKELFFQYKCHEGTLNWYDTDFWSQKLDLDIVVLKEQINHLITVHPHVKEFLTLMKDMNKKIFLLTNAHYKTLDIKLKKTKIGRYFDRVITSFDMELPKENLQFWAETEKETGFDKDHSLFIDDTIEVLRTAELFGIRYVVLKSLANSQRTPLYSDEFLTITDFRELIL
jgi:HAD superfamily hydrolase (TIGR01509 family)